MIYKEEEPTIYKEEPTLKEEKPALQGGALAPPGSKLKKVDILIGKK